MSSLLALVIIGLLIFVQICASGYVYLDAPEYEMNPVKWAGITLFVPFFGLFAYLFEREEREGDSPWKQREEMFVDGPFQIHKSRVDDVPWASDDDTTGENAPEASGEPDGDGYDAENDDVSSDTGEDTSGESSSDVSSGTG